MLMNADRGKLIWAKNEAFIIKPERSPNGEFCGASWIIVSKRYVLPVSHKRSALAVIHLN